jgi:hypothetical protein
MAGGGAASAERYGGLRTTEVREGNRFRLLMNSVCPPRCPLHSPGLTCMRTCTPPRAGAASTTELGAGIKSP